MKFDKRDLLLYAVTDRRWTGEETLYTQVEKALTGGATFVQLREKNLSETEVLEEAREIQALCRKYGVPFVIDDDVELAVKIGADGVHVGQSDLGAAEARKRIGPDKILGVSAQTIEQARQAEAQGADYLGVGAVFSTGSKDDAVEVDHQEAEAICRGVSIPAVAIGGITAENAGKLAGRGFAGIAVISSLFGAEDIGEAARRLRKASEEMVKK